MVNLAVVSSMVLVLCVVPSPVFAEYGGMVASTTWTDSHATFYGGNDARGTMGGACGYGNLQTTGYGLETAALSSTLFNNGLSCGACFEIMCRLAESRWCYAKAGSIKVTATNTCPANPARSTNNGGWCNPPRTHFDLSYPMFTKLAKAVGGIIPIQLRRVSCVKVGGVRFVMNGNPWFNLALVYNVAGDGNVVNLQMKGSKTKWFTMKQNWGQNWELKQRLQGQAISFRVTLACGKVLFANNIASANWKFQQNLSPTVTSKL